jgi:hypothetical protein
MKLGAFRMAIANSNSNNRQGMKGFPGTQNAGRWLALGVIMGPILFDLDWIVFGQLRSGYSPISEQISALAIGPNGIFVRAGFLLYGLLVLIGIIAIFRDLKHKLGAVTSWICAILLGLSPFGILWAGIFTMDKLVLHTLGAFIALGTPMITFPIVGLVLRRVPNWRLFGTLLLLGCPLTLALLIGFTNSVPMSVMRAGAGGGNLGLWQRALFIEVQAWFVAIGWLGLRETPGSTASHVD